MISFQIGVYISLFVVLYFQVFLLMTFIEHVGSKKTKNNKGFSILPSVAVIVPCWNEENTVTGTLESLLALDYPKNKLEIIAVNDGSTDGTLEILKSFESNPQVIVVDKENGGKHSAMNEALKYTSAEFIGVLDADSYVNSDALKHIIKHFADEEVVSVTPGIKVHNASSILQVVQKAEYGLAIFIRKTFSLIDALFITPGPFSFLRRSVIDEVGPWRHGHGTEDLEMCLRLQKHHKKITNEPNAIVYTTAPKNFSQLFRQRVRWGYGFLKNSSEYRNIFFNPQYGALGMLILPISYLSIFSSLFLFSIAIWNMIIFIAREVVRFQTIGITVPAVNFDLFFVHTSTVLVITLILITLTLVLMGIGKRMLKDPVVSFDMLALLVIYGFITPLWLAASVYKAITSEGVRWR